MKIILLSPPERDAFAPMLALPSLTAYLRENNYEVIQRDIGVELLDYFYNKKSLEDLYLRCKARFDYLDSKKTLNWIEQVEYARYLSKSFNRFPYYIDHIDETKRRVKDASNYQVDSQGKPLLENDWLIMQDIRDFIFQSGRKYAPFRIRELSTNVLFQAINNREEYYYSDFYENKIIPSIKKENPDLVGISITFPDQVIPGLLLAYLIKEAIPHIHLTVGGSHFSLLRDELPNIPELFTFIDSFVINEGEYSLLKLIRRLENKEELFDVPNLVFKNGNDIAVTELEAIKDIRSLPCPDFTGLPFDKFLIGKVVLPYAFSRGCYWGKCTFCNFHHSNLRYRIQTPERVVEDLQKLSKLHETNLFYFSHEADPPVRMKKTFSLIKEAGLNLSYFTFCRFDENIDLELLQLLKDTGCSHLYFGLESGNERINSLINKGINYDTAKRILKEASSIKLLTSVSSINCFPTETEEEQVDTAKFYEDIVDKHKYAVGGSHIFRLAKGSPVELNYKNFGIENIFYESSGNLNTVLNFNMKEKPQNDVSSESKKHHKMKLANFRKRFSHTTDYTFLLFAGLDEIDFLHWLKHNKGMIPNEEKYDEKNMITESNDIFTNKFLLSENIKVREINFPFSQIKKEINRRSNIIYKLFYDEGYPLDKIAEKYFNYEEEMQREKQIFLYDYNTGEHVLLRQEWKLLLDYLKFPNKFDELISRTETNYSPQSKSANLVSSIEKTITALREKEFLVFLQN